MQSPRIEVTTILFRQLIPVAICSVIGTQILMAQAAPFSRVFDPTKSTARFGRDLSTSGLNFEQRDRFSDKDVWVLDEFLPFPNGVHLSLSELSGEGLAECLKVIHEKQQTHLTLHESQPFQHRDYLGSKLSSGVFKPLAGNEHLEFLLLYGRLSPDTLDGLGRLKALQQLHVRCTNNLPTIWWASNNRMKLQGLVGAPSLEILRIESCGIDDEQFRKLKSVSSLKQIYIQFGLMSGEGLSIVEGLPNLIALILEHNVLNDRGFRSFSGSASLKSVYLGHNALSDRSVKHLVKAGVPELGFLNLHQNAVTDACVGDLARLKNLKTLVLSSTQVTGEGLEKCESIEKLDLAFTRVTSAGIRSLATLPNLKALTLDHTDVTDDDLKVIAEIPTLEYISFTGTSLSKRAIANLKEQKPSLKISETYRAMQ